MNLSSEKETSRTGTGCFRRAVLLALAASALIWLWACAAMQSGYVTPSRHPLMEGEDLRYCSICHEDEDARIPFNRFVHTLSFADNHGQPAARYNDVCAMCHRAVFCSDCHGVGVELKPSLKNGTETYRRMPHRGDYLTRHRIDGRINPASCYRCHGNPKTALTCKPCHG